VNILQVHAKVFLDLLDADNAAPPLLPLDSEVQTGQLPPYVVLYFAFATPSGSDEPQKVSKEATSDVLVTTATCHSVGETPASARVTAGRVRAALLGKFPVIAGRGCYPIEQVDGPPLQRDESTGTPVFDQIHVYEFTSQPG
jgi:hypothetical protein